MVPRALGPIQGSMAITGLEARLKGGVYGDGYLGWSHIDARNINALADAIEVVHSYGGYQFKQNYFGRTFTPHTGVYQGPQNETGTVDNISFQYQFSFGALARYPEDWWGDGPDLVLTVFGMLSIVDSKAPPIARTARRHRRVGHEHQEAQVGLRRDLHARSTGWGSTGASTTCSRISTPRTRARPATRAAATSTSACSRPASCSARSS